MCYDTYLTLDIVLGMIAGKELWIELEALLVFMVLMFTKLLVHASLSELDGHTVCQVASVWSFVYLP